MKEFLLPTFYCDVLHPLVISQAFELQKKTPRDTAIAVWSFIAKIPYRFDFWNIKASETLAKRQGMCTNKANLQIALLRALGIPAGYGVMRITKDALESVSKANFYAQISSITTHVFCYVYLDHHWVAADATSGRRVLWNGEDDYKEDPIYVVTEEPMVANLDEKLGMKPRFLTDKWITEANQHIDELEGGLGHA